MPNAPYFSQYVSPNIVIVPTECYYGPPKPKQDRNVLHQNPDSSVENCLKPDSFKIPNLPVTNRTSENSATNNQELKQSMQTSLQNEVPKPIARHVNKNSSAIDNNLGKTTKQGSSSWASNYLLSIGQLHKKNIKLNLSEYRKKGLTLREDTSVCTASMNSKKETNKTSSAIINDKERWTAITMNYKIPLKTSAHPTPKYNSKETKMPLEKTETIVNQISTDPKHTKPPIKCDSKNITHRNKITEHVTLQNSDSKSNTENLKIRPESNRKATRLTSSCRRNSEWKNEEKHEKDINKTKSKDLYSIKNFESKKKDKTNSESTMIANTSKPEKNQVSENNKNFESKKKDKTNSESTMIANTSKPENDQDSENNKTRHMNSASKSSAAHSKNERSTKPLKISNFFLNADTEKNLGASKRSKSSKISRSNEKEDKYVKNRTGSTKNKKDHPYLSTKKSLDFGIKKKSKKCTLDTEKKSKSKSCNLKPSTKFLSTIKDGAFDDHRSSSKDSIKSVVQLTDSSLHHKHKIDENFDLRTKLSPKGLNHYFTKIHNAFSRYSIPNKNRENLIITVQNEINDDNEQKDLKNVHEPSNDDDNERMDLKNVHEPSPDKDSKDISVSREYKKIKVVINLICQQPSSHKPDQNENCGLTNEDLSFLDDFNVDEIVETLKHCENESIGANHNVELDIEVHAGLEKTNPVSLDIRENKTNYSVPKATETIVRSRRKFCDGKLSHEATFVKIEKNTNDDTLIQGKIQETSSKINIPHNKNINDTNITENVLKDQSSSNQIIPQLPTVNNVQLQEIVNVVKIECVEAMEAKPIKNSTKTANSEYEVSINGTPVISNIKKEPGFDANNKSDKISNEEFAIIGGENNDSSVLGTVEIKSEPQSNSTLSNTLDALDLREKLRESGPHVEAVDNLPEVTNININCLHEDDDNASDVTLVLSPPHFGDFSLIDLTNELDVENVSEIENFVKKEIETTGKTAEKLLDDLSLIDSSNDVSIEKFSEIENYVKKETKTTGKTAENLLDDLSMIDSSNELLSIEKVHVSEIENYVKKEIDTTGKTAEKLLDNLSSNDSSNELSIEKVSVSEMENYVKKEKETTGKSVEKLLDNLNLINSSNKLIEKDINVESHSDTDMKDIERTQNIPPDSVTKPTEHTESFLSNTPNASDASKTPESGAFSNTIKSEGSSNLEKCGKRKNEDLQNESKSKILKVEDCVSNRSVVSVCAEKEQKEEQQQSKTSQSGIMCEPDKLIAQNLEQRMLSYLCEQYTITSVIHKGTFSKIFHCQNSYGKVFAVKVINRESNRYNLGVLKEKMLMKIQQEIPKANYNCVHIYNGFSLTGFWCFLMEYYPVSLMQAISKKKNPFHINAVQNLAKQLVAAVTVLRNYNIVHADICPRHILLDHSHTKLKLCGFDGSYYIDCAKLVPNIGTVSYRAPEVILGFSAGYSIDVWSTALVIYEMTTGKKLFPGCFNNDILYKQMCTLGNIPDVMVMKSLYKYSHFTGLTFVRKVGPHGKKLVFIREFFKSNRLRSTILNQYKRYICNPSMLVRAQYCEKLGTLCSLLEGMLVLHPNHRLAIEFVYSNPFIFEHFL